MMNANQASINIPDLGYQPLIPLESAGDDCVVRVGLESKSDIQATALHAYSKGLIHYLRMVNPQKWEILNEDVDPSELENAPKTNLDALNEWEEKVKEAKAKKAKNQAKDKSEDGEAADKTDTSGESELAPKPRDRKTDDLIEATELTWYWNELLRRRVGLVRHKLTMRDNQTLFIPSIPQTALAMTGTARLGVAIHEPWFRSGPVTTEFLTQAETQSVSRRLSYWRQELLLLTNAMPKGDAPIKDGMEIVIYNGRIRTTRADINPAMTLVAALFDPELEDPGTWVKTFKNWGVSRSRILHDLEYGAIFGGGSNA